MPNETRGDANAEAVFALVKQQKEVEATHLLQSVLNAAHQGTHSKETDAHTDTPTHVLISSIACFNDKDGFSLLHWASMAGYNELVILLIEDFGIDVNARGINLQTPLMWAAMDERLLTMLILIDHGADVHAKDDLNDNCLTLAAQHEKLMSCLFFLHRGINVDNANVTGSTAAHWAAFCGAYMLLAVLMTFGADMHTSYDHYGLLPIHRALQLEYYATAKLVVDLDKSLLDVKTRDGMDLTQFADKSELSQQWFQDFLNLCRDPSYQVRRADKKLMGEATSTDEPRTKSRCLHIASLRQAVWSKFVDVLINMESSKKGKALIPALALLFSFIFTVAWFIRLSAVHWFLCDYAHTLYTRMSPSPAFFPRWFFHLPQRMGLVAIVVFVLLLFVDPGFYPRARDRKPLFQAIQRRISDVSFVARLTGVKIIPMENSPKLDDSQSSSRLWRYLKKYDVEPPSKPDKNLVAKIDVNRICPTCWILKDLRTKHCSSCDACCSQMDHHCLWINKCVGRRNHRLFITFTTLGGLAQWHQILLTLCLMCGMLMCKLFHIKAHPAFEPTATVWEAMVLTAAAAIHVITYEWSSQLMASQIRDVCEGVFINEVLSYNKYAHFICDMEYTYSDEKVAYMKELLEQEETQHASTLNERDRQVNTSTTNTKIVPSEVSRISEVVPSKQQKESPQGKISNTVDTKITRHFIRNPFALDNSAYQNCLDFWLDKVPSSIDYRKLEDFDRRFKQRMLVELREKELRQIPHKNKNI
eukprot:Blabericola_migrator_1__6814@NODE_344_length_9579_cov_221_075799_g277_i0_p2_GENE_NODE_344_length_9579_cov_221_075799_g277_i0NODE_344_length_9579_cov_221_075799_g277_i0_p2_ORF_typecomplete_len758_score141_38Ank_2/PF12796_7/1_3e11Ank_2/PF12796_7/1_2e09Ank_2/PF12796_7/3e06Ank_2/PF12796_7/16Ank_2/PF12796_7/8_4e03DHHC/PF01529_20/5_2e03DHHC/PF01529_20/2_9e02DHHC/PF01529_20/9e22Ank_5/PF13857_6/0_00029Ank_5/PF13857_6/1_6e09Ank_5/PF13857_6/0_00011Ank_5/PF13857_6/3_1e02Ank_4/PF13637_6/3_5e09Ank_4/PF13637_